MKLNTHFISYIMVYTLFSTKYPYPAYPAGEADPAYPIT